MKRKRGNERPKPTKPPVFVSNQAVTNDSCLNAKDQTCSGDFDSAKFYSRLQTETPRADTNMSGWQAEVEKQVAVNEMMENFPNSFREMIKSIISDLSKESGGITPKPSRVFGSSSNSPISNASLSQPQVERIHNEKSRALHQDPRYKEQELNAALSLIKKIMKLDAAEPFRVPVDPIASGILDYFDVIDTPMDFGTICNNLENGLKYMNSEDVYKDVQYIWENCRIYNKKGAHVLKLMNRVKKNFMKDWNVAGLYREQPQAIDEPTTWHSKRRQECQMSPVTAESTMRYSKRSKQGPAGPVANKVDPSQVHPQLSSHQPQPSLQHSEADTSTSDERFLPLSPTTESNMRGGKYGKECPVGPVINNPVDQKQDKVGPSQVPFNQSPLIHSRAFQPQLSSNQPNASPQQGDGMESTSMQKRRRGRGPARCLKLLTAVQRIVVAANELGQPIGPEAATLSSFLGIMARDGHLAPLNFDHWSQVPYENKEKMLQKVQSKFDIDPISKSWVLKSLADRWRKFKSLLKTNHYDTHTTDVERLADRDERVLPDQWLFLVSQWSSEKWQNICAINKANRAKVKFSHTSGTKSFARIYEEEKTKRPDGKEPSRAELFILTHTHKNGEPVNDATAAVISELRERTAQQQETLQNNIRPQDDIFSQVMGQGRSDSKRLYGLGLSPSDLGARTPSHADALRMVSEANSEVHEMKEKMSSMEKTCAQMAAQMATMMSMMASMQKSSPDKHVSNVVADTPDASEGLPQQQVLNPSSFSAVPSRQTRARKKR